MVLTGEDFVLRSLAVGAGRRAAFPRNMRARVSAAAEVRSTACWGLCLVLLSLTRRTPSAKSAHRVLIPMRSDSTERLIPHSCVLLLTESTPESSRNTDRYLTPPTAEGQSQEALLEGTAHGRS
jgi:hypothetical protein